MDDWFKARLGWADVMQCMTDTEAGQFAKAVWDFARTGVTPDVDGSVKFAVMMAINTLSEDLKKRTAFCEKQRENGLKGGRPKKTQQNPNNPTVFGETQQNPKKPIRNKIEEIRKTEIREEKQDTRYYKL